MSTNQAANAGAQLDAMKSRLTDALLRGRQLAIETKANNEQIDALTNFLAGSEVGARDMIERAEAKVAANKASLGTAKVGGQDVELIDDTGGSQQ